MSSPVFKDRSFIAPPPLPAFSAGGWTDGRMNLIHILRISMDEVDEEMTGV